MKLITSSYCEGAGWSLPLERFQVLDSSNTLITVFGASQYAERTGVFAELAGLFPSSCLIGGSTAGEIFGNKVADGSLSVGICKFEHSTIKLAVQGIGNAGESRATGRALGRSLAAPDLRAVLVLSEGLIVNGSELAAGFRETCPDVPVTGGLAADGDRFKKTWTLRDGKPVSNHVTAVGFYGDHIRFSHGSQGGWDIFGPERRITRATGNILYELDGRPALALYREYLGEKASALPSAGLLFPLQIRANRKDPNSLVRTILGIDETSNALIFAGDVPQGHLAQLMRANFDRLVDGASLAAKDSSQSAHSGDTLAIAISCVGRRLVLGERIEEEVEATLAHLSSSTRQIGFYSYGEISPHVNGSPCELHNQTMTLTLLSEAA